MAVAKSYDVTYSSYSGCDIVASITIPQFNTKPLVIGELQTISYSIHREVVPVRTLGRANPKGFTSGTRTIAGSLIFTVFDSNLVQKIVKLITESYTTATTGNNANAKESMSKWANRIGDIKDYAVMDEMPPFDVTVSFTNEYGNRSSLVIKGIVIVDEGQVMSIEDMITENTMSFMAMDIQVMKSLSPLSAAKAPISTGKSDTALSALHVSSGTLSPNFDPAVTTYKVTVPEGTVNPPLVTGTPRDPKATLVIVPATKIPGATQVVVSGTDQTLSRYKINFTAVNQEATLSALKVAGVTVSDFDPDVFNYVVTLPYSTKVIPKVEGTPTSPKATVTVNRTFSLPGTTSVVVAAQDKSVTKTYNVMFALDNPSVDSKLATLATSAGALSPAFSANTLNYTVTMPSTAKTAPSFSARASSSYAKVQVNQTTTIPGTATIVVTAQDGVTQTTYTIQVKK